MGSADHEPAPVAVVDGFFAGLARRDPAAVRALFHPSLTASTDPVLLARLLSGLQTRFGSYRALGPEGTRSGQAKLDGALVQEYSGTVHLERLDLPMNLVFHDGLLAGYRFLEPAKLQPLLEAQVGPPEELASYVERGKVLVTHFTARRFAEAHAMLLPEVRARLSLADFESDFATRLPAGPPPASIEFVRADPGETPHDLWLLYRCGTPTGPVHVAVGWVFKGLVSGMLGVRLEDTSATGP